MSTIVNVNIKVIKQCLVSLSNIDPSFIKEKIEYERIINNNGKTSLTKARNISKILNIPFGYLFLNDLPKTSFSKSFRTIANNDIVLTKDLNDVLLNMVYKKNWISDYRKNNLYDKISIYNNKATNNISETIKYCHKLLQLNDYWYKCIYNVEDSYRNLKKRIEDTGVIVMSSGCVDQNVNRRLDVNDFRGFVLFDNYSPLIFINSNDDITAKCFTMLHEFIHLIVSNGYDDFCFGSFESIYDERFINSIVAEFLIPKKVLIEKATSKIKNYEELRNISSFFKVSLKCAAIALNQINRIDTDFFKELMVTKKEKKVSGGNYYRIKASRLSMSYSRSVFQAVESNYTSYTEAYRLLDLKGYKSYKEFFNVVNLK